MAVVNTINPMLNPSVKDSRWLTLEVCREYQRNKCTRTENECKFAHPRAHVEVQNGRVVACFDSIKGKCQRKDPPCKYLHPPQHLREQLLQNGRNNLILRSLQMQAYHPQMMAPNMIPVAGSNAVAYSPGLVPGQIPYMAAAVPQPHPAHVPAHISHPASYVTFPSPSSATAPAPQYMSTIPTSAVTHLNPYGLPTMAAMQNCAGEATILTSQYPGVLSHSLQAKAPARPDRLEVCREYQRGTCSRQPGDCRYAHPTENVSVDSGDNQTPVVDVVPQSKKRLRDTAEEILLQPPYVIPPYKRMAVEGGGYAKSGMPMYHQALPTYQQATLMQLQQLQQLQQQPSYPLTYSSDMMSAAYANYFPQVAGHPPTMSRY